MITPNKFVSLNESVIGRLEVIIEKLHQTTTVNELYASTAKSFRNIDEFVYAMDVLYILGRIKVDLQTGEITKC